MGRRTHRRCPGRLAEGHAADRQEGTATPRAEDRIRAAARAAGLRNLPLHRTAQNRIWLEIVQFALDLLAWMPMLALTGKARCWEPRRLRLRLFTMAGQVVTTGRRQILRLARRWPWTSHITTALVRLALLPNPG
ncbi:hypothetical protein RKD29_007738 [Streptomyces tendae]